MISEAGPEGQPGGSFSDLDAYVALPRLGGLWLSPDGRRLVTGVATPDRAKNRYTTALWEIDPAGIRPARRLTRSSQGESEAAFTPSGDLLFVSSRPDPAECDGVEPKAALWLQPAEGGDARVVASPAGGVHQVVVARTSGTVVTGSATMPSATGVAHDREVRAGRKDAGVSAILHEEYPIRFWDHDLVRTGPGCWLPCRSPGNPHWTFGTSPGTQAGRWTTSPHGTSRRTAAPW